jgi:folate-binding protein YgfZ
MAEVQAQAEVKRSPLHDTHAAANAVMVERDGWLLPSSYGDAAVEYSAVREGGAGLIDLSSRARINVSGSEAVQFLNGLITNDVKALEQGSWMHAAFPNVQGRLLAMVRVLHRADGFLLDMEPVVQGAVLNVISKFTLAGDFHVTDLTDDQTTISIQGARAADIVRTVLGDGAAHVEPNRISEIEWMGGSLSVIRATHTAEDGFDLFIASTGAAALWEALATAGATPVGFDVLETLRIEAGIPRHGVDMSEANVVLENGIDEAVSYTKGCYLGQEIIARIHWRGHVAKQLFGLVADSGVTIQAGDAVRSVEGKNIGTVTSVAVSPKLDRTVALAMIKYDYLKAGTPVTILSNDIEQPATTAELPLLKGSWSSVGSGVLS